MTPADAQLLRDAASRLRRTAELTHHESRWDVHAVETGIRSSAPYMFVTRDLSTAESDAGYGTTDGKVAIAERMPAGSPTDVTYMSIMDPQVGLEIAEWLQYTARDIDAWLEACERCGADPDYAGDRYEYALNVARKILRRESTDDDPDETPGASDGDEG